MGIILDAEQYIVDTLCQGFLYACAHAVIAFQQGFGMNIEVFGSIAFGRNDLLVIVYWYEVDGRLSLCGQ